jgi:hypothetical protein
MNLVWEVTGVSPFYIGYMRLNAPCPAVHKISDAVRHNCLRCVRSQSCIASYTSSSSANWRPSGAPLTGARSELYAWRSRRSDFSSQRASPVWAIVWGQAMLCKAWRDSDSVPLCFVRMAGLSSFRNTSESCAPATVLVHRGSGLFLLVITCCCGWTSRACWINYICLALHKHCYPIIHIPSR